MSDKTAIEWTEATWNPLVGCTKVSPGCDHCYAETLVNRFAGHNSAFPNRFDVVTMRGDRMLTQPLRWKRPRRIFVNSLSDLFHKDVPDEFIARVWQVMGAASHHTYQLLTKRHARMRSWTTRWYAGEIEEPYAEAEVVGYPGYRVTTTGLVIGKRGEVLTPDAGEQGHARVTMHRDGSPRSGSREFVHRLVLTAFSRRPRSGEQARHLNGDATDNRLSNLAWGTQEANWQDRSAHGARQSYTKLTEGDVEAIRRRAAAGESAYAIAKDYPVSDTQVRNIVRGRQWATPLARRPAGAPRRAVLNCVWLGVSVEDRQWADTRIPALLDTPAAVRWISAEPLLGPVTFRWASWQPIHHGRVNDHLDGLRRLDWVVVGGESGPGARPMVAEWARTLRDECAEAGVPFLFKQWGNHDEHGRHVGKKAAGRLLDGVQHDGYPVGVG